MNSYERAMTTLEGGVPDRPPILELLVDGKLLMKEKVFLTIDTARVKKEAIALGGKIQNSLNSQALESE